jgi:hypothetical protein
MTTRLPDSIASADIVAHKFGFYFHNRVLIEANIRFHPARDIQMSSGDEGDRTPDLGVANAALSQLSYIPTQIFFLTN